MYSDIIKNCSLGFKYVGNEKTPNPNAGDVVINIKDNITSVYDGTYWSNCLTVDRVLPSPTIEYREIKPKVCVRCGAPLHGYKCEYCDTEYS